MLNIATIQFLMLFYTKCHVRFQKHAVLLLSHAVYDQMLIRFKRAGLIWVHHVLIGKMSPDVYVKRKKEKKKMFGMVLVWFMDFEKIKSEHNKTKREFGHLVELAVWNLRKVQ